METMRGNDEKLISDIKEYFEKIKDYILKDISDLVSIRSVRDEATPCMPFGEGTAKALNRGLRIAEKLGFTVKNGENYVGIADFSAPQDIDVHEFKATLGILAHLDVVPEGTGWSHNPYDCIIKDGKIYGRGTADDKGPAVVSMYAVKAAHELSGGLKKPVRVILGTCEETGSEDLDYYKKNYKMPDMVFSPDAEFPLINVEKGRYAVRFETEVKPVSPICPEVIYFHGGDTQNIVPQEASCCIRFDNPEALSILKDFAERTSNYAEAEITIEASSKEQSTYIIHAVGTGAHASTPEKGNNAQTALLCLLVSLYNKFRDGLCSENRCSECQMCDTANFFYYAKILLQLFPHGDTKGRSLGVDFTDEKTGDLTLNFGVLNYETGKPLECGIDIRYPVLALFEESNYEVLKNTVKTALTRFDFEITSESFTLPHCTDENSEFVRTLLDAYEAFTGNEKKCIAIGGGTYVHDIPGGVAFGCAMPGTDNRMHGADEFAVIDELITSAEIFTYAIIKICNG